MGFDQAADAIEGRDRAESSLNRAVYRYSQEYGYSDKDQLAAQSSTWPLDKIAEMAAWATPAGAISGPINGPDDRGIGELYFDGSSPTREQIYTMLELHAAREAAAPTREALPLIRPGVDGKEIPTEFTDTLCAN